MGSPAPRELVCKHTLKWTTEALEVRNRRKDERVRVPKFRDGIHYYTYMNDFKKTMMRVKGVAGFVPIWYIGRPNKPLLWNPEEDAASQVERIIYQCRRTGPEYEEDRKRFYAFIEESCVGTPAEDIIKEFEASRNGQAAI